MAKKKERQPYLFPAVQFNCMNDTDAIKKSLEEIQDTFTKKFERFTMKIPEENIIERTPGSIPYGSGRLMFVFGFSDSIEFMEYYGHHRMGDCRGRINEDGKSVSLPELP